MSSGFNWESLYTFFKQQGWIRGTQLCALKIRTSHINTFWFDIKKVCKLYQFLEWKVCATVMTRNVSIFPCKVMSPLTYVSVISTSEFRLSSAICSSVGSGSRCGLDWLAWASLSRDWMMAWRRQEIHCCLLKESLACRLWDWAFERPLLLTRKQFFTEGDERMREKDIIRMEAMRLNKSMNMLMHSDKWLF